MSYKWVRRPDFRRKIRYLTFWVIGNQIFMHIQPKITYSLNRRLHLKYLHIKNTIESKICWKSCIQIKCKILRLNTSSIRFLFFLFTGQIVHMCIFSVAENCHLICHLVSFISKKVSQIVWQNDMVPTFPFHGRKVIRVSSNLPTTQCTTDSTQISSHSTHETKSIDKERWTH